MSDEEEENCPTINQFRHKKKLDKTEKSSCAETLGVAERNFYKERYKIINSFSKFQMKKNLTM